MMCEESLDRMSELLDGLPSEELEAHLVGCPSCRGGLESMRRADAALRSHPAVEWRPELTEAILRRARSPARWFLPIAACVAAAAIAAVVLLRPGRELPRDPLARHVSAVRCIAEQEGIESLDRDVLSSQLRQLNFQGLSAEIAKSSDRTAVRDYVQQASHAIESAGDVQRLWSSARELRASCALPDVPARIEPVAVPTAADLYAAGRLHFANGDPVQAVRALDGLVERHPASRYADASCLALAGHFAKAGDDLSALAFYASVRSGESITPNVARSIREVAGRAGHAFAGPSPITEADVDGLRRCAESRTPYGLVRTTPEGRVEAYLLGPVRGDLQATPEPIFVCASLVTRRFRFDLSNPPAGLAVDPMLREMLGAMRGLAK
jgi:hypothetical protein